MAFWKALGDSHDLLFGSKDLYAREYDQFVSEAKVIGESLCHDGSKISWSPGKTPSYDSDRSISYYYGRVSLQGVVRKIKDHTPGFVANCEKASANAVEWAGALYERFTMEEKDTRIFTIAQRAFANQALIYGKEGKEEAKSNYQAAAAKLGQFIHKRRIEEELRGMSEAAGTLSPEELDQFIDLKRKVLSKQEWYRLLNVEDGPGRDLQRFLLLAPPARPMIAPPVI